MWNNVNQESEQGICLYHLGMVVENNDPLKMQRIKVTVPNRMEGPVADLDWVGPIAQSPFGVGPNFGSMFVPAIGSVVLVYFQDDNIKYGLYAGSAISVKHTPHNELLTNYPKRYGFSDPAGNLFYTDYTDGQVKLHIKHKSGTQITVDNAGNVTLNVVGNTSLSTQGNTSIATQGNTSLTTQGTTSISSQGTVSITSSSAINASAPTINLN